MNNNFLLEYLEGHEGETFYFSVTGSNVVLRSADTKNERITIDAPELSSSSFILTKSGGLYEHGECMLFPSKDQRSWLIWSWEKKEGKYPFLLFPPHLNESVMKWLRKKKIYINAIRCEENIWLGYIDTPTDYIALDRFYDTYEKAIDSAIDKVNKEISTDKIQL